MKITVEYFAQFRDQAQCAEEVIETASATAAELYGELATTHQFSLPVEDLKLAVNEEFAPWSHVLQDGDTVVFIPPVAGG